MRYIADKNQQINTDLFREDLETIPQSFLQKDSFITISPDLIAPWATERAIQGGDLEKVSNAVLFTLDYTRHDAGTESVRINSYADLLKLQDAVNRVVESYEKIFNELIEDMVTLKEQAAA